MSIKLNHLLKHELQIAENAFAGQVIVITGSGRGIGLFTAQAFALLGGTVVLAEISDQGKTAEAAIQKAGGEAHFIRTDVADPDSVNKLAEAVKDRWGAADILINNAIFIKESTVTTIPLEVWDQTIAVNLRGTFLTCKAFLPGFLKRDRGLIINMVSTDAMPGLSAYIASKQGIAAFSQSLALEIQDTGVRVIPFAPGMVDTPGIRSVAEGLSPLLGLSEQEFLSLSLHADYDGLMPPEHAAAATVYLARYSAADDHGQICNGYEILEKAGLLQASPIPGPHNSQAIPTDKANALLEALSNVLQETEDEFNQLPIFVRPIAKQGFKSKAGASLAAWQTLVSNLINEGTPIPADMVQRLKALSTYYKDVPQETARFTKDQTLLKEITQLTEQRLRLIDDLIQLTKTIS